MATLAKISVSGDNVQIRPAQGFVNQMAIGAIAAVGMGQVGGNEPGSEGDRHEH
jgi:hypothetical protein